MQPIARCAAPAGLRGATRADAAALTRSPRAASARAGLVEKDEFIKKIHTHFGIKAEL